MIGGQPWWRPGDQRPSDPPVVGMAAAILHLRNDDIVGPDKTARRKIQKHVRGRALVAWALRAIPAKPVSYPDIGLMLGGIGHTSAMHLHVKAIGLRMRDREFAAACRALLARFNLSEEDIHAVR